MKNWALLFSVVSALAFGCSKPRVSHDERLSISTATLATLIRSSVPMTILDARTGTHDDGRRIPGAVSMAPDAPTDQIERRTKGKDGLVVTYCKDPQCPNFAQLAGRLRSLGYTNVLTNPAGIEGWVSSGLQVVRDPNVAQ